MAIRRGFPKGILKSRQSAGTSSDGFGTASTADDLDYMHARFANPGTGRFLSVDPSAGSPGIPRSLNRYTYGISSPLMFTDPTGKFFELYVPQLTFEETITSVANGVPLPPVDPSVIAENFYQSISRPLIPKGAYVDSGSHPSLAGVRAVGRWFLNLFQNAKKGGGEDGSNEDPDEAFPCDAGLIPEGPPGASVAQNAGMIRTVTTLAGEGPAALLASVLAVGPWNYNNQNRHPSQFDNFGNFNFGAVAYEAGVPLEVAIRGGGVANVGQRLGHANISGATRAALGVFGIGSAASRFGDDTHLDVIQITVGWYFAANCL